VPRRRRGCSGWCRASAPKRLPCRASGGTPEGPAGRSSTTGSFSRRSPELRTGEVVVGVARQAVGRSSGGSSGPLAWDCRGFFVPRSPSRQPTGCTTLRSRTPPAPQTPQAQRRRIHALRANAAAPRPPQGQRAPQQSTGSENLPPQEESCAYSRTYSSRRLRTHRPCSRSRGRVPPGILLRRRRRAAATRAPNAARYRSCASGSPSNDRRFAVKP
jgi:hypothetical protein